MAKYLFTTIQEIKTSIGGGANVSLRFEDLEPLLLTAAQKHMAPWIGEDFWLEITNSYPAIDSKLVKLYPYLQNALAPLAIYEYLPLGRVMFTGNGLIRNETDHQKTAFKYQEADYEKAMLQNGYDALERALKFLLANKDDYPTWRDSEEAARCTEGILMWSSDFRLAYGKGIDRYTFETLLPLLLDVEAAGIEPVLGNLYEKIRLGIEAKTLSAPEKKLLKLARKAICNAAMEEAFKRQLVQLRGTNIVVPEKLEPQGYEREGAPTGTPLSISLRHEQEWATRHLANMIAYLRANTADFPTWVDPYLVEVENPNQFKTSNSCTCSGVCICNTKAVVRL